MKSSCCAIAPGLCEEVHVNRCDCPINRKEGREVSGREECTCVFYDGIFKKGYEVEPCEHYEGVNQVNDDWFVICSSETR